MTNFLLKHFIKSSAREDYGKLAGVVGVVSNLLLFVAKLLMGLFAGSLSIITDGVNNLSDSASSLITILGFKLSERPPDAEHPYGHARYEYVSGLLVAFIVVLVGVQFLINSVKKIINPEPTEFNLIILGILCVSIIIKVWQSRFYFRLSKKINSKVLASTGIDSRNDVVITFVILLSSIVEFYTGLLLDGYMGAIVSVFLIYSGVELLKETISPLIGEAPKKELVDSIKNKLRSYSHVIDVHDLLVHYYGPERVFASAHVEIPSTVDIMESHEIIDQMELDVFLEMGINIVIHLDPVAVDDPELIVLHSKIEKITKEIDDNLSIHDFRIVRCKNYTRLIFDVFVPESSTLTDSFIRKAYREKIEAVNRNFKLVVIIDRNYSSTIG